MELACNGDSKGGISSNMFAFENILPHEPSLQNSSISTARTRMCSIVHDCNGLLSTLRIFKLTQSKPSSVVKMTWNCQSVPGTWHNCEPWLTSSPNLPSAALASLWPLEGCCRHPAKRENTPCSL